MVLNIILGAGFMGIIYFVPLWLLFQALAAVNIVPSNRATQYAALAAFLLGLLTLFYYAGVAAASSSY